jgi:predicted RNase H-like nuclease (RuvC/YqgF family)
MKKLSIKINGITYVPKADTLEAMQKLVSYQSLKEGYDSSLKANIKLVDELEQKDIIINQLQYKLDCAALNIEELTIKISDLEETIMELEVALDENDNTINELRNTLDDIEHVLARTH